MKLIGVIQNCLVLITETGLGLADSSSATCKEEVLLACQSSYLIIMHLKQAEQSLEPKSLSQMKNRTQPIAIPYLIGK